MRISIGAPYYTKRFEAFTKTREVIAGCRSTIDFFNCVYIQSNSKTVSWLTTIVELGGEHYSESRLHFRLFLGPAESHGGVDEIACCRERSDLMN